MEVAFMYTLRCNIVCGHCSVAAGPDVARKMELQTAYDRLRQLADDGRTRVVIFTGGEVLIHFEDVRRLVAYSTKVGLYSRIVSNAFWATNPGRAVEKMTLLHRAGLSDMMISADEYHLPFVPAERVRHALDAVAEVGLTPIVNRVETRGRTYEDFLEAYGLDGDRCVDVREIADLHNDLGAAWRSPYKVRWRQQLEGKILVRSTPLSPEGRGRSLEAAAPMRPLDEWLDQACPEPGVRPAISPEGRLYPCCSPGCNYDHFAIGDMAVDSAAESLDRLAGDALARYLREAGPVRLVRLLKENGVDLPDEYSDLCNMCCRAFDVVERQSLVELIGQSELKRFLAALIG